MRHAVSEVFGNHDGRLRGDLKAEILTAISEASGATPADVGRAIQANLGRLGWDTEVCTVPVGRGFPMDAVKQGVGVEVELGLYDYAFREWAKFQKALNAGLLSVGVHIVPSRRRDSNVWIGWAENTLKAFADVFSVPIVLIGVDL